MSLNEKLTALATSIRTKSGVSGNLSLDAMKTAVDSITTGGGGSSGDEEWYQEPPNDGKTRLYIDVAQEHRKDISIKSFLVNGTESNDKYIDWGDGSSSRISTQRINRNTICWSIYSNNIFTKFLIGVFPRDSICAYST